MRSRYRRSGPPVASPEMAIVDDDIERVRAASPIVDVVQQLVAPAARRSAVDRPVPVPRRAHAQLLGERRAGSVLLLRLRGQGRRVPLRAGRRAPRLRRSGGVAGQPRRHHPPVHDRGRGPRPAPPQAAGGGDGRRRRVVPPAVADRARRTPGEGLPPQPRHRRRRRPPVPARLGAGRLGRAGAGRRARPDVLRDAGLAFSNRRDRMQDAFRARVIFPIFNEVGDPVAFGGRVLPGSKDPAKYKNSPETPIYTKSQDALRPELGQGRRRADRPGRGVRGLHGRDRVPPGRRRRGPSPPAARPSPRSTCAC